MGGGGEDEEDRGRSRGGGGGAEDEDDGKQEEEAGSHLEASGAIWETYGRHLEASGGIWETFGRHLDASGRHLEQPGGSGGDLEASGSSGSLWSSKVDTPLQRNTTFGETVLTLLGVFEGTIDFVYIFTATYWSHWAAGSGTG